MSSSVLVASKCVLEADLSFPNFIWSINFPEYIFLVNRI